MCLQTRYPAIRLCVLLVLIFFPILTDPTEMCNHRQERERERERDRQAERTRTQREGERETGRREIPSSYVPSEGPQGPEERPSDNPDTTTQRKREVQRLMVWEWRAPKCPHGDNDEMEACGLCGVRLL